MKPLTIHVDDILTAAQPWDHALPREELDEMLGGDLPSEFHAGGAAIVAAKLTRMGRKVLVQAAFTVPLSGVCKRCLKDVALDEPVDLTLTFNPRSADDGGPRTRPEGDATAEKLAPQKHKGKRDPADPGRDRGDTETAGSFEPQLADEETYTSKSIDLWPFVREQILLAAPPSPLCSEGCKGLCPECGQDLNLADCGHRQVVTDPRWEALKAIQLKQDQPKHRKE